MTGKPPPARPHPLAPGRRAVVAALALPALARAQPAAMRIVSPYAPGGASDTLSRFAAQAITEALGIPVVVENRPGAGGNLGAEHVARAPADGSVWLTLAAAHAANVTLYRRLPFDVLRDFTPACVIGLVPNLLAVHPSVPVRDFPGFLAWARAQPQGISYGSAGVGTLPHLAMELIRHRGGFAAVHLPFRGSAPAITELVAGRIHATFENLPPSAPHARAGAIRPIAVSTSARLPDWPEVPAVAEYWPGFEAVAWQGLVAPRGVPMALIERIAGIVLAATRAQAARLRAMGVEPAEIGPDRFPAFLRAEVEKWAEAVRLSGASAE
ncbi:MAG: tripartite tricarboxylate transporter substrate-binding protein [Rhodovarius sp.]|nr:tripartite tricarboxylate transporter substrate-binding protein [Rhodovarius sp.]